MIQQLFTNIKAEILNNTEVQSCLIYPDARGEILAPAVFLEVANYGAGDDPATGELALIANIEARIVVDSISENAELACQALAYRVANLVHLNNFGCPISPAKVTGISHDSFKPDLDPYICWLVEWSHQFHVGSSIWDNDGIPSHTIYIGNEEAYG